MTEQTATVDGLMELVEDYGGARAETALCNARAWPNGEPVRMVGPRHKAIRAYAERLAASAAVQAVAQVTLLTLPDGKKAKVLRALSEQWIVSAPDGILLYASVPGAPADPVQRPGDHLPGGRT